MKRTRGRTLAQRFYDMVDINGPEHCWLWQGHIGPNGYSTVGIRPTGNKYAHVVAWSLVNGRWPTKGLYIIHSCDNKRCVNPYHLSEGTPKRNSEEARARGLLKSGEQRGLAKLSWDSVRQIRRIIASGTHTQKHIGRLFGVSQGTVHRVVAGKHWVDKDSSAAA